MTDLGVSLSSASRPMYPLAQTWALARRSIVSVARQPAIFLPAVFFPLFIAAVNSSAMGRAINLPGFPPVDSFWQFLLPATMVQGVLFGGIIAGSDVALDIQDGFFDRLVASPVSRTSILLGRLSGASVLGAVQAVIFITVFRLFGAHVDGGLPAVVVLVLLAMILAVAVGGLAAAIGLRTGSQEAVQNSFPLVFVFIFLSSAFFPTELMSGWYQTVAQLNPLSWMIDAARSLVIDQFSLAEAGKALGIALALAVASMLLALRQLRRRLAMAA
jgi:ABC-2 type transport system permease protein